MVPLSVVPPAGQPPLLSVRCPLLCWVNRDCECCSTVHACLLYTLALWLLVIPLLVLSYCFLDRSCDSSCLLLVYSWLTRISSGTRLNGGCRGCHSSEAVHLGWGCSMVTHGWGASQPWSWSINVNVLDVLTCLPRYLCYSCLYLPVSSWLIWVRSDTRLIARQPWLLLTQYCSLVAS